MKFGLWTEYGAMNSKPIFEAFAEGCRQEGHELVYNNLDTDVAVIWSLLWNGRMAQNKRVWDHFQYNDKPVIVLEVGGIKRGTTWKMGVNGINAGGYFGPKGHDNTRAKELGLKLKPWVHNNDGPIVICCQHPKSHQWRDQPALAPWVTDIIENIRYYSGRDIIIRPHPRYPLDSIEYEWKNVYRQLPQHVQGSYDDFDFDPTNAWAVISWNSNPGPQSVIQGIPAFVGPESLAKPVANTNLQHIETPITPDREQWLNDYAHTEWTVEEIATGFPLKRLTSKI